ncbi:hypothetical protein AQUCO_06700042v1 [Aquilegia coerulea]|uniref:Uncharacterized protein n=1 Tax=Aquilegia coerulea TaxID=218851 RepID=A0A2G5CBU8_AQUCA|nr:hypothetical protein AQUCO_06700042v1 [Aquilegia coerulea]
MNTTKCWVCIFLPLMNTTKLFAYLKEHRMPDVFFGCNSLTSLRASHIEFNPTTEFSGFGSLVTLQLNEVLLMTLLKRYFPPAQFLVNCISGSVLVWSQSRSQVPTYDLRP